MKAVAAWLCCRAIGPDAAQELHLLGGWLVLGWLGEGTRSLEIGLPPTDRTLVVCWGLYPRVAIGRRS